VTAAYVVITGEAIGIPIDLIVAITDGVAARYPHAMIATDRSGGFRVTVDTDDLVRDDNEDDA
jgi:hypothetical protein